MALKKNKIMTSFVHPLLFHFFLRQERLQVTFAPT